MQHQNSSEEPQVGVPVVTVPLEYSTPPPHPSQGTDLTFYVLALIVFVRCLKIP